MIAKLTNLHNMNACLIANICPQKYFSLTYYIRTFDRIRLRVERNLMSHLDIVTQLIASDDDKKQQDI